MPPTRREALATLAALTAGCARPPAPTAANPSSAPTAMTPPAPERMPAVFLPHGGGPWPFMDLDRMGLAGSYEEMERYMRTLGMTLPRRPDAVLVVSAHWEEAAPTVMSASQPPMLYDYSGFPPETYEIEWPAPGAPELALRTRDLLEAAGIPTGDDAERGFDHGTFVPMMLAYPEAGVPTYQLSLKRGLDPQTHLAMGRAIAPLRDENVLILGSGMSYHNMRGFFGHVPTAADDSRRFDDWLVEACAAEADTRDTRLTEWLQAPAARACHPREEHLIPLMVVAGAAGEDTGTLPYRDELMGVRVSAAHFA